MKPPVKNGFDSVTTENGKGNEKLDSISQIITEKKDWNYFWRRVISDITNKDLIPVKILFFFQYASKFSARNCNCMYFTVIFKT